MRKLLIPSLLITLLLLVGCDNITAKEITPSELYFPVQKKPGLPQMEALGQGWLVEDDGCLRLKPNFFIAKGDLIIWPYGYSFDASGQEIQILDRDGNNVAHTGQWIKVHGGKLEVASDYLDETVPDNYPGPYWIVSEVVSQK